jgi:DNA replication protein DnaC
MSKTETVKTQCRQLKMPAITSTISDVVMMAEKENLTYLEFVNLLFNNEINQRMENDKKRRTKQARLPLAYNLDLFDFSHDNGISEQELKQLRELKWLEQNFNIILMGPSGTGKTYIAAGLCFDAVDQGYRAYFKTMEELIKTLKMKDMTRTAATEYKRIINAHLLVIDDIMIFPMSREDAVAFFNLINELHNQTSLIITTNKSPKNWADILEDKVLTTAILDRILYRCEIIKLSGESYRMNKRKTIFENNNNNS